MTERIDFETQARYIQEVRERIGSIRPDRKPPTYYIRTFGCQMNENESEKYTGMLEMMGFTPASDMETADFVLFNTCCVRENAELKVFGHLGALKGLKREKPWMMIAVAGCMMQEPHVVEEIKNKSPLAKPSCQRMPSIFFTCVKSSPVYEKDAFVAFDFIRNEQVHYTFVRVIFAIGYV
jgi:tRNA A37 methylthiotransferase MiaB